MQYTSDRPTHNKWYEKERHVLLSRPVRYLGGWFVEHSNVDTSLFKLCYTFVDVGHLPERVQETEYNEPMQARVRGFDGNITGLHESVQELRHVGPFCHGRSCVVDTNPHAIYLCRSTIGTPLPSLPLGTKWRYAWLWSIYYVRKKRVLRVHTVAHMCAYARGFWSIFSEQAVLVCYVVFEGK